MNKRLSFRVSLGGIVAAMSLVCMFFTGVIPVFAYTLPALAGVFLIVIVIEISKKWAFATYAAVGILSIFLTPDKEAPALFIMFLGYYPIIKSFFERIKIRIFEWVLKLASFNLAIFITYTIIIRLFGIYKLIEEFNDFGKYSLLIFVLLANVAFVLYDIALTGLISTYIRSFQPKIHKIFR